MADVFISYSRKDGRFTLDLARALEARGKELWVDTDDIGPGAEWRDEIKYGLEACDGFVFVLTPNSLASTECAKELAQAVELGKRIVPILHGEPNGVPVPDELAKWNWIKLRDGDPFELGVAQLIDALEADIEWVRAHTRLGQRAVEWDAHSRNAAYLLRGSDLADAETMLTGAAGKDPQPSALQLTYVAHSRTGARRRQRILLGSVTTALFIAISLAVVALIERSSAISSQHHAFSRQLAADAETQIGIDPELSVLLASKAYDVNPTQESVAVLRQALVNSQIRMRVAPPDGVSSAALTPDGRTLVTVGRTDGVVRRWRYPNAAALGALPGVTVAGAQMSVNPVDGRILVAAGGRAEVFNGTRMQFAVGSGVTAAAWDPTGRYVLTGAGDGHVGIWRGVGGGLVSSTQTVPERIEQVAMSPRNRYFAALTASGLVLLYDLTAKRVRRLALPAGPSEKIRFSPDEGRLLGYGPYGAKLWNTSDGRSLGDLSAYDGPGAAFAPDGTEVVLTGEEAVSLDARTGKLWGQYLGHDGRVTGAAPVSGWGNTLIATAGRDGTIRIWQPINPSSTLAVLRADATGFASLDSAQRSRKLVTVDVDGRTARVWAAPLPPNNTAHGAAPGGLSPDGRLALDFDDTGHLQLIDAPAGRVLRDLPGARGGDGASTGFTGGGRFAYELSDGTLRMWRTADGARLPDASDPRRTAALAVSASDGSRIVLAMRDRSGGGGAVAALSPPDPRVALLTRTRADALAVSSDGSTVAYASGPNIWIVRGSGGTPVATTAPWPVSFLALSADGRRLAAAGASGVTVFSSQTGHPIGHPFPGTGAHVTSLALSADGTRVAAGYDDVRARVWAVDTGDLLLTAKSPNPASTSSVGLVAISPDDTFLLTGAQGAYSDLWDLTSGATLYQFNDIATGWSENAQTLTTGEGTFSCPVCVGGRALRLLAAHSVTRGFTAGERAKYLTQ
jgi:WD40 repeat protein